MSMMTYNLITHLAFITLLSLVGFPSLIMSFISKRPDIQFCLGVMGGLLTIVNFMAIFIFFLQTLPNYLQHIHYIK